jgi:HK97 family phage major capsid protein
MIHNNNFWRLQQLKDSQGRYILNPQVVGPVAMSIWGIPFVKTTQIASDTAVLGDWKELYMYLGQNLLIDSSSEAGNRFDQNLTGFRVEEEMGLNANQNFRAFTLLTLT